LLIELLHAFEVAQVPHPGIGAALLLDFEAAPFSHAGVGLAAAATYWVGAASIFGGSVDTYLPISYAGGGAALGVTTGAVLIWLLRAPDAKSKKVTESAR